MPNILPVKLTTCSQAGAPAGKQGIALRTESRWPDPRVGPCVKVHTLSRDATLHVYKQIIFLLAKTASDDKHICANLGHFLILAFCVA